MSPAWPARSIASGVVPLRRRTHLCYQAVLSIVNNTAGKGSGEPEASAFAGRIGAGAAITLSERFDLIAEYDFTYGQDAEFEFTFPTFPVTGTAPFELEVAAHRVLAGIRARF